MTWTSADEEAQKSMEAYKKLHPGPHVIKMPTKPIQLIWQTKKDKWVLVFNSNIPGGLPVAWITKTLDGYKATFKTQRHGPYYKHETRLSYFQDLYYKTLKEAKTLIEHETRDIAMHAMKQDPVRYKKWIK